MTEVLIADLPVEMPFAEGTLNIHTFTSTVS